MSVSGVYRCIIAIVFGVFSVCGTIPVVTAKTTITVMSWQLNETQQTQAWFQHAKETFESRFPDVEVALTTAPWGEEYRQRVLVGTAGGTAPDVVHLSIVWARELYERGALLPLNSFIDRDRTTLDLDDFIPITQIYNSTDGIYFGITSAMDSSALLYNLDLFEEAGLDVDPNAIRTWSDFESIARKLRRSDGAVTTRWAYQASMGNEVFNSWLVSNGGSFYTPDELAGFNSPNGLETARFLANLWQNDFMGGDFTQETAAMMHGGNWSPYFLYQQAPNLRFNVTSYPKGPSGKSRGTTTWGNMYSITRSTAHPDLAWEFVKYYTSLEALVTFFEMVDYVGAPRASFYQTPEWLNASQDHIWMPNIPQLALAGGVYPFLAFSQMNSTVWNPIIVPALQGEAAIEPAFEEAERLYNQILTGGAGRN